MTSFRQAEHSGVGSAGSQNMSVWTRNIEIFLKCRYELYLCTHKCTYVIQACLKAKGFMWHSSPGSPFSIPTCAGGIGWNQTSLQVTQRSSPSAEGILGPWGDEGLLSPALPPPCAQGTKIQQISLWSRQAKLCCLHPSKGTPPCWGYNPLLC